MGAKPGLLGSGRPTFSDETALDRSLDAVTLQRKYQQVLR